MVMNKKYMLLHFPNPSFETGVGMSELMVTAEDYWFKNVC